MMLDIKYVWITIFLMLTIQSCGFTNKQGDAETFPAWVATPQADTNDFIYGIGSGYSYEEAKVAALKDISGKLITEISSQTKSEVSQYNSAVTRSANINIDTRTIETQLSDYKVINSEQINSQLFIQISMSRSGFIKTTESQLNELDSKIKNEISGASKKTRLQQFVVMRGLGKEIAKARSLVLLLQAAGSKQNTDEYLTYYNSVINKTNEILYSIRFHVISDNTLHDFAKHLVALLNNENISATISSNKNADAYINISGEINNAIVFSQHMAQLKAYIKISDKKNRVISIREFVSSGSSTIDSKSASSSAIKSMGLQFRSNGVLNALGILENI